MENWKKLFYGGIIITKYYNNKTKEFDDVEITDGPLVITGFGRNIHNATNKPTFRPKGRKDYHFLYVKSGLLEVTIDNEKHILGKNNLIFYLPGMPQIYNEIPGSECITYWIHFGGTDVQNLLKKFPIPGGINRFEEEFYAFENIFNRLYAESRNCYRQEISNTLLLELIILTSSAVNSKPEKAIGFKELLYYMSERCEENHPLKFYAEYLNFSEVYFVRFFKKAMGVTPHQHIINLRLEKSCKLLLYSKHSVNSIAAQIGYTNPHYFCKVFKEKYGVTPTEYRISKNINSPN